jgi:hypothetical protein
MRESKSEFYVGNDFESDAPNFCRQSLSTGCSICTKMKVTKVDKKRTSAKCTLGFFKNGGNWNFV